MIKLFNKLKCKLGFHKWSVDVLYSIGSTNNMEYCKNCLKQRIVIKAILQSDLMEMVEKGELSYKGYLEAIKRGHVIKSDFELKDEWPEF